MMNQTFTKILVITGLLSSFGVVGAFAAPPEMPHSSQQRQEFCHEVKPQPIIHDQNHKRPVFHKSDDKRSGFHVGDHKKVERKHHVKHGKSKIHKGPKKLKYKAKYDNRRHHDDNHQSFSDWVKSHR